MGEGERVRDGGIVQVFSVHCAALYDCGSLPCSVLQTCRYYLKGSCVYGSGCRYSHVRPKTQEDKKEGRR